MMYVAAMSEFDAILKDTQSKRLERIGCEFSSSISARMNDAALVEALILGLPMAQGIQHRILRSRGRGVSLTAKIRYRQAVRMLEGGALSPDEIAALDLARSIAAEFLPLDAETRFNAVYDWVCRNVRYVHTAPGQKGYERLVCASGALLDGKANCQGFADVLYLLSGLCGIACEYRIGRGERRLHVWNAVRLNGEWREADASKGARGLLD